MDAGRTLCCHDQDMLVTLILRLVAEPLADGDVVGEVEHVGGEQIRVNGVDELLRFARGAAAVDKGSHPS